jgi:hypothetical protein
VVAFAELTDSRPTGGVDPGDDLGRDACRAGAGNDLRAIRIEAGVVQVYMAVDQLKRHRGVRLAIVQMEIADSYHVLARRRNL